jgi:L-ascorbate metabolism protein UlaG (beta-lactamase superfamily)
MNIGGSIEHAGVTIHMVNAVHSSPKSHECGFVIELDGKTLYHLGDTALFGDLALYGRWFSIDLAMIPIGDRYTMGPRAAAEATRMLGAQMVIPMHYDTFPPIQQDPQRFVEFVGDAAKVIVLAPGGKMTL